jgi:hypothetical protein
MITGLDFGGTQGDTVFSARDLRSSSGATNLATPPSSRLEPSPFGNRPLGTNQPSQAVDSLGSEEMEIPESPSTVRVSPAASVERHHNNRDSNEGPTATTPVTQVIPPHTEVEDQPEGQEQGQEEPDSSGGDLLADSLALRFLRLSSRSWSLARSLKVKVRRPCRSVVHGHRSRVELCRQQGILHVLKVEYASTLETSPSSTLKATERQPAGPSTCLWVRCGSGPTQACRSIFYEPTEERSPEGIALRP